MNENQLKTYFWFLLDLFIIALIVNLVFFVMPTVKNFGDFLRPARTLSLDAQGEVTATPDMALVYFSVVTQGKNPEDLANANSQKMSVVVSNLESQGIDQKDIETTAYNLAPNYQEDVSTGHNYITGYTLTQTVEVKIRDLNKTAVIVGGVIPLGVNQIGNISFTFSDTKREELLTEARDQAIVNLQAKAAEMAGKSRTSLGKLIELQTYSNLPLPYNVALPQSYASSIAAPVQPPIQAGNQNVTVTVNATYQLQ